MSTGRIEWGTDTGYSVVVWKTEEDARWAGSLVPEHKVVSRYVIEGDWEEA